MEGAMPVKILIVDDSVTVRIVLKRLLTNVMDLPDLRISEAGSGLDGLAQMRAERPDLVLADLNMDQMTGMEMIERMRRDPALASIPVAVISSEGNQGVTDALSLNGVCAFIRKPFDLGTLSELLPKVLAATAG
jgi:two-component system chemotaxis response regulator CheY